MLFISSSTDSMSASLLLSITLLERLLNDFEVSLMGDCPRGGLLPAGVTFKQTAQFHLTDVGYWNFESTVHGAHAPERHNCIIYTSKKQASEGTK